jgi:hypothetical protein
MQTLMESRILTGSTPHCWTKRVVLSARGRYLPWHRILFLRVHVAPYLRAAPYIHVKNRVLRLRSRRVTVEGLCTWLTRLLSQYLAGCFRILVLPRPSHTFPVTAVSEATARFRHEFFTLFPRFFYAFSTLFLRFAGYFFTSSTNYGVFPAKRKKSVEKA